MPEINFDCYVLPNGQQSTFVSRTIITSSGATPDEVWESAKKAAEAIGGCVNGGEGVLPMMAAGIHNRREDWEAVFGPAEPDAVFADSPAGMGEGEVRKTVFSAKDWFRTMWNRFAGKEGAPECTE